MAYPGIYRAKAASVNGTKLQAFIPQVFGDVPVTVESFIGDVPTTAGMGWVSFQGGNPEFPVWHGAGTGGGGGTVSDVVWVGPEAPTATDIELWWDTDEPPSGGGGEEVYIGAEPPGAGYELWYDTDAAAPLTIDQRWNTAWGIIAKAGGIAGSVSIATNAQLSTSMTVTLLAGRRYRAVCQIRAISGGASAASLSFTIYDGSTQITAAGANSHHGWYAANGNYEEAHAEWVIEATGQTYSAFNFRGAGAGCTAHCDQPSQFYIEDMGPIIPGPAPAPVDWAPYDARYVNTDEISPPWITLPLNSPWIAEDSGFQAPSYRKIGDLVYLRGSAMITGVAPGGNFATTQFGPLPVGYRPAAHLRVMCGAHKRNVGGCALIRGAIYSNTGFIEMSEYSATDKLNPVIYLGDIPPFSVTA